MSRINCPLLAAKLVAAEEAVAHIHDGDNVGFSGFTGAGYPKAVPAALAATMIRAHDEGRQFQVGLWTSASTAPDADSVLAAAHGISTRLPYNSDPTLRGMINAGDVRYIDAHLSHSAQHMWFGFYGKLDVAVVEVTAALGDGLLVPSSSVGTNKTWLDQAERVILEVNEWQPRELEGFHDIYYGTALPPSRRPIMLTDAMQRIGEPYLHVDRGKSSPWSRPTAPTATRRSAPSTAPVGRSPGTWSTSYATRSAPDGCRRGCCRSSPASATSPTPS
jgi:succinyl-CoA:acetate CoA-transferase